MAFNRSYFLSIGTQLDKEFIKVDPTATPKISTERNETVTVPTDATKALFSVRVSWKDKQRTDSLPITKSIRRNKLLATTEEVNFNVKDQSNEEQYHYVSEQLNEKATTTYDANAAVMVRNEEVEWNYSIDVQCHEMLDERNTHEVAQEECIVLSDSESLSSFVDRRKHVPEQQVPFMLSKESRSLLNPTGDPKVPWKMLNDEVIGSYIKLIERRYQEELKDKPEDLHFFGTFQYETWVKQHQNDREQVYCPRNKKLFAKLLSCTTLFVPINFNKEHWVLCVVDLSSEEFRIYDSIR